jgi:GNAT superfamily N-acetyltransferase
MSVMHSTIEVRRAGTADLPAAAAVLSRAFYDDRIFRWIIPDDERRAASVPAFFALFTEAFAPHDAVFTAAGGRGAALWLPPGRELVVEEQAAEFGQRILDVSGTHRDASRMQALLEVLEANHPHEPCWFLNFLGVDPSLQGRGVGSTLLRVVLERADRDGTPAYLDATSPENRRLYERHGFVVTRELSVDGSPPLYSMWREPVAGRTFG